MKNSFQQHAVYHSDTIRAWEKRWFALNNSSYGLMQQAALAIAIHIQKIMIEQKVADPQILIWCGQGNNAGDGYLTAKYLQQAGFHVSIYAQHEPATTDANHARQEALDANIEQLHELANRSFDLHIDALYGIGLSRTLNSDSQRLIEEFNYVDGIKIAIDLPSGLHPNTGVPLPTAIHADYTLCVMALKLGLLIGKAQEYVGEIVELPLIPKDPHLTETAYISFKPPVLPLRKATQHKGSFGHVLVIGGHPTMGGAVIMSGESAIACGAGKVTVMCDVKHHTAIVARSPNIMVKDIKDAQHNGWLNYLSQIDTVCFGMGLGRDACAEQYFNQVMHILSQAKGIKSIILDADALWFLAKFKGDIQLQAQWIATPHSGEAARLLNCAVEDIENDRISAIEQLSKNYGGQWVLKGAGTLTLEQDHLNICAFGNAGMGTAGMGDVLSGMMAGLKAQFQSEISIADIVALHALAGDVLARDGMRGIQAHHMVNVIPQLINYQE